VENAAIRAAVELAGLKLPDDADVEISGVDPVLPSPHHLGEGAAVARALTGIAAADLWRLRGGDGQTVSVDVAHAAASLRSYVHTVPVDEARRRPLSVGVSTERVIGIYATADGRHVQLHGSFNDGPAVLEVLGLSAPSSQEEIASAVAQRSALELEDAFIERRLCGGMVRSRAEWAEHPQGRALAGRAVVTITRIGDAPPEPLPLGDRPLSGTRVIDLTRVLAGPTVAKTLAEHGADVLHVSAPGLERGGPFEIDTGIGKRQTHVDLRDPVGTATMRRLLRDADVFSQGYRRGTIARRGFGPEDAASMRPGIVYVSENCYGPVGPWAERPGWEQLAQAATGMSHREGVAAPDGVPRLAPAAVNDYTTGFFGAYGAMVALGRRVTEGGSWHVEVSLSATSSWYQSLGDDLDADAAGRIDVEPFLDEMDTDCVGRLRFLRPAVGMSLTPPRWDLPPSDQGTHEPAWLPR
jgi:crotonobetainyl-CoA:carnitine CoA-transferase CaiB-like acyl-CoA transferase